MCITKVLPNVFPCMGPQNGPEEIQDQAVNIPCKVMKVFLGVMSLIAAGISGITLLATGNPLALVSTVIFGFAACYLLSSNLDKDEESPRRTQNIFNTYVPRPTPPVQNPVFVPVFQQPHVPRQEINIPKGFGNFTSGEKRVQKEDHKKVQQNISTVNFGSSSGERRVQKEDHKKVQQNIPTVNFGSSFGETRVQKEDHKKVQQNIPNVNFGSSSGETRVQKEDHKKVNPQPENDEQRIPSGKKK